MNTASELPTTPWDLSSSLHLQIPAYPVTQPGDGIQIPAEYSWSGEPTTVLNYIGNGPYVAVNSSCYISEGCFLLRLAIERVG